MKRDGLPDGFGRAYRRAVFAHVSTARAIRLAWVLVDAAYSYDTLDVELGYRLLERETGLTGWSVAHARDDLLAAGLLTVRSQGRGRGARTRWVLRWNDNVRSWAHVSEGEKRALKRAPERALKRALERAPKSAHESESESESENTPLSPPQGGQENGSREIEVPSRRRRRDRRSNRDVIAEAVARHNAAITDEEEAEQ